MNTIHELFGIFFQAPLIAIIIIAILAGTVMGYGGVPLWSWFLFAGILMFGYASPLWLWIVWGALILVLLIPPVRRLLITRPLMKLMEVLHFLPKISDTEQAAIEAGTVWMDGELFSGKPDFRKLLDQPYPELTEKEQAFLDGPVEELCAMVDDWDVFQRRDFTPETWEYIKKEKFFGMIIPREYGGLGMSSNAHSAVIAKLASNCGPLASTVMVPNSLGPAELLLHYGTKEQKDYYLPRLASGDEIPCFALTEPHAGSDAGGMRSYGEVFKGEDGKNYIRLNWDKRWITLAAISTLHGLAFKLKDPKNLLGKGTDLGITCALVHTNLPGVTLGRRHDPMDVPFYNCPTHGHDVVISVDDIIGGPGQAGKGWRMLMEALAAGRGISLPASATGLSKVGTWIVGAHAKVRKQFGLPIGLFEGVEEPMARVGGFTYILEAMRRYTCGALDKGAKPAIVTAMVKYNATELGRKIVNDAMDVLGGTGITRGPRNLMAHAYIAAPISITVEGANILTRTLMIFGQGAIRCHPYIYKEIKALMDHDAIAFDQNFTRHIGHFFRNLFRSVVLNVTRGLIVKSPIRGKSARYFRKLGWVSARFAFLADIALITLGGALKSREKLTGRFADILSWMYIATTVLRRYEADGRPVEDEIYLKWTLDYAFGEIQRAFEGIFRHLSPPALGWLFRGPLYLWCRLNPVSGYPSDKLGSKVARSLMEPGERRDRLTKGMFIPKDPKNHLYVLNSAFKLSYEADELVKKMVHAIHKGELPHENPIHLIDQAVQKGILNHGEAALIQKAETAREEAIKVDSFTLKEYFRGREPYYPTRNDQARLKKEADT